MNQTIAIVSGGFDPIHIGHVRMFREASDLADKLFVIINNDNWLRRKKGYVFMPEYDRLEIISSIKYVDWSILTSHQENPNDMSVCRELQDIYSRYEQGYYFIFCNGGDRKADNIPEYALCERLGIEMKFGVGGNKLRSSSDLVKATRITI